MDKRARHALLFGVLTGAAVALPAGLAYFFLHPPRRKHKQTPKSALGLSYRRVSLRTDDGHRLSGWWVPHPEARAVVVVSHGYFGNRETMLPYLKFLHDGGYSALLYDFRSHGWSEGKKVTFGKDETADLQAALDWTFQKTDLPVALLGESMGAAVSLLVAADEPRVAAVVADSAFARLDSAVLGRLTLAFGPTLARAIVPPTQKIGERLLGFPARALAPIECVGRIAPRPLFLIHGDADGLIEIGNAHALREAAGQNSDLWVVNGSRHVRSVYDAKDYGERVLNFLNCLGT